MIPAVYQVMYRYSIKIVFPYLYLYAIKSAIAFDCKEFLLNSQLTNADGSPGKPLSVSAHTFLHTFNCSAIFLLCSVSAETLGHLRSLNTRRNKTSHESLTDLLKDNALQRGYKFRYDPPKDGNCMFHALTDQLKRVKSHNITHIKLRECLVQYLWKNPNLVSLGAVTSI